jgi:hypothetical protein
MTRSGHRWSGPGMDRSGAALPVARKRFGGAGGLSAAGKKGEAGWHGKTMLFILPTCLRPPSLTDLPGQFFYLYRFNFSRSVQPVFPASCIWLFCPSPWIIDSCPSLPPPYQAHFTSVWP